MSSKQDPSIHSAETHAKETDKSEPEVAPGTYPVDQWDRYRFVRFLGQGGMGKVYLAEDLSLSRKVALKFFRGEDAILLARFLQEARAQARIVHDHVGKVYEVGDVEGKQYIAMQYIDGKTLGDAAQEMVLDQKIRVMRQVAEALHSAHMSGLIHRDIKPSNIMLEKTETGEWKPYVVDFGLAKELHASGMTVSGVLLGTPAYMPPEQARGEIREMDRRSDVYSLGATLHEILCGKPPFDGPPLDVLRQVLEEDPVPLRKLNPRVPEDLETIVLKCLQKEPQRRYDSARALAEDLENYLEGDPVVARRSSVTYRVFTRARKHKWTSAAILVAILAMLLFAGGMARSRYLAGKREALARQLGEEVRDIEATMESAYLLPLHDVTYARDRVRQKMKWIESQMQHEGDDSVGLCHDALGRGHLILHEHSKAREHLELAWNKFHYQKPEVAFALGLALVEIYKEQITEAERISNKEEREAKKKELDASLRLPALEFIRKGKDSSAATYEYGEALAAFLEKRYKDAADLAQKAVRKEPSLYQADRLAGDTFVAMANQKRDEGKDTEAEADYHRAEENYTVAVRKGESDSVGYESLCSLQIDIMLMLVYHKGEQLQPQYDKALTACSNALVADPGNLDAHALESSAHFLLAEYQKDHDQDAIPQLEAAEELLRKVVQIRGDYDAYLNLGRIYWAVADNKNRQGKDPLPALNDAITNLNKARSIRPGATGPYTGLALAYMYLGDCEMNRGVDPRSSLQSAISNSKKALEIAPDHLAYMNLAGAWWSVGSFEAKSGLDPRKSLQEAARVYSEVIRNNPGYAINYSNLGGVYSDIADYEVKKGLDPSVSFQKAIEIHMEAIRKRPDYGIAPANLGYTYFIKAKYELGKGVSPQSSIDAARKALQDALALISNLSPIWEYQGQVITLEAQWSMTQNRDPDALFASAQRSFDQALKVNPESPTVFLHLAELHRWKAERLKQKGLPASQEIQRARDMANKALKLDPELREAKELLQAL